MYTLICPIVEAGFLQSRLTYIERPTRGQILASPCAKTTTSISKEWQETARTFTADFGSIGVSTSSTPTFLRTSTNRSAAKGGVLGSTLTLPSQYGFILSALLALFIRIIGDNLWGIACFIFHQIKATPKDRDDFYHQIQIVLRNAASESRVVRDVIKICQSRNTARLKAYIRGLPLVVIAGLHILAIFAAGTFSSNALVRQENEVLVRSDTCGWLNEVPIEAMTKLDDKNAFDITNKFVVKSRARYRQGASYSRGCYRQDGTKDCNTFVRKVLPSTVNISAPCPFDQKICNGPAISVDTGFIYSDSDLGINTKPENRISGRKTLQCVSLRGEDYTDGWISLTDEEAVKAKAPPNATIKGYKLGTAMQPNPLPYIFWVDNLKPKFGSAPYWVRCVFPA